jgi:ferredoxin
MSWKLTTLLKKHCSGPLMVFYKLNLALDKYYVGQPWSRQHCLLDISQPYRDSFTFCVRCIHCVVYLKMNVCMYVCPVSAPIPFIRLR